MGISQNDSAFLAWRHPWVSQIEALKELVPSQQRTGFEEAISSLRDYALELRREATSELAQLAESALDFSYARFVSHCVLGQSAGLEKSARVYGSPISSRLRIPFEELERTAREHRISQLSFLLLDAKRSLSEAEKHRRRMAYYERQLRQRRNALNRLINEAARQNDVPTERLDRLT